MAITSKFDFSGDEVKARKLQGLAQIQLLKLRTFMKNGNLKQYSTVLRDRNGTVIKASSVFGSEVVSVYVPVISEEKKKLIKRFKKIRLVNYVVGIGHYLVVKDLAYNPVGYTGLWDIDDTTTSTFQVFTETLPGDALSYSAYPPGEVDVSIEETNTPTYSHTVIDSGVWPTGGTLYGGEWCVWYQQTIETTISDTYNTRYTLIVEGVERTYTEYGWGTTTHSSIEWHWLVGSDSGTVYIAYFNTAVGPIWGTFYVPKHIATYEIKNSFKLSDTIWKCSIIFDTYYRYTYQSNDFPLHPTYAANAYTFWLREDEEELLAVADKYSAYPFLYFLAMPDMSLTHTEHITQTTVYINDTQYRLSVASGSTIKFCNGSYAKVVSDSYKLQEGETLLEIEVEE